MVREQGSSNGRIARWLAWVEARPPLWRRVGTTAVDAAVALASLPAAFWLRYGDLDAALAAMPDSAPWLFLAVFLPCARLCGLWRGIWRHVSLPELAAIARTTLASVAAFTLLAFLLYRLEGIPRSLPLLHALLLLVGLGGPRIAWRALWEGALSDLLREMASGVRVEPVLVIGTGPHVPVLVRELRRREEGPMRTVGLLTLADRGRGWQLAGVPVLGTVEELPALVRRLRRRGLPLERVVLAERLPPARLDALFATCRELGLELLRSPDPLELERAGRARVELRPLELEDLLERPQIRLDDAGIRRLVEGRRVLVTGAGGSIGSELARQILGLRPAELVLLDHAETPLFAIDHELSGRRTAPVRAVLADVRDRRRMAELFGTLRPELVFHAAALKHVPMVERHPREGVLTNVIGTRNVADAAMAAGCALMVLISTDKAVRPTSVMGATKRLAEFYCQMRDLEAAKEGRGTRFVTVRFGNVLGSNGSVVPLFREQIARGGPVTVTHAEVVRYFMTIPEAVQLVLHASAFASRDPEPGGIFVLDMGKPVRVLDLAEKMIRLAGLVPYHDVEIVFTGLRPGEKLREELFDEGEVPERVASGVFRVRPRPFPPAELERVLALLEAAVREDLPERTLLDLLERSVPGYQPSAAPEPPSRHGKDARPAQRRAP